jgi:ribonuclease R
MEKKIGQCFVGVVVSVTNFGLFIRLYDYVVEGLLHINDLPKDYYKFNAEEMLLEGKKTKTIYKVGQKIKIQVEKVDVTLGRVDFKLTGS